MNLRRKTLLSVATVMIVMTVAIVLLSSVFVMGAALDRENENVRTNLDRVAASMEVIESEMGRTAADWAVWNDTYLFLKDRNQAYIDSNLGYETCGGLRLNYFLLFNSSFELVYGMGYDCNAEVPTEVSHQVVNSLLDNIEYTEIDQPEGAIHGLVITDGGILMVYAHSVSDNDLTDTDGFLVLGRYIDDETAREISETVKFETAIYPKSDLLPSDIDEASWNDVLNNGTTLSVVENDTMLSSYRGLDGLNASTVGVIMVQTQRDDYAQALESLSLIHGELVLISLASCSATLVLTDRFTTRRLDRLSRQVENIGRNGGMIGMIEMDGTDELTRLAENMNRSMETIMAMSQALAESEKRYHAIVNDQTERIFRMDGGGRITFVNEALLGFLGLDEKEAVQMNLRDLTTSEQYEDFMDNCSKASATGSAVVTDHQYHEAGDVRERWMSWTIMCIPTGANGLEYQCVGRDLTKQKEAENALAAANKKLNLLASITRHDITNKLTVAHGFVNLARRGTADPSQVAHLAKAEAALESIGGYLEFTRDYQLMGMAAPAWIDLGISIDNASAAHRSEGIDFIVDTRDYQILGDPLVEKVFYNLFDNSQRHGEKVTRISVTAKAKGDGLLLTFEDNGVGIPPEEKDLIFQAGYGKNTGYGLFLAKEIITSSGMTITETGEAGQGTRFEIFVPPGRFRGAPGVTSPSSGSTA
ncbi:MAG: PAS domain S-box protein [Methanomassiliicoccales archaeon]|nr:PAS domain S-box protein [Methanomassiliicoccales archaeon]